MRINEKTQTFAIYSTCTIRKNNSTQVSDTIEYAVVLAFPKKLSISA
jgi:hypothetical protein